MAGLSNQKALNLAIWFKDYFCLIWIQIQTHQLVSIYEVNVIIFLIDSLLKAQSRILVAVWDELIGWWALDDYSAVGSVSDELGDHAAPLVLDELWPLLGVESISCFFGLHFWQLTWLLGWFGYLRWLFLVWWFSAHQQTNFSLAKISRLPRHGDGSFWVVNRFLTDTLTAAFINEALSLLELDVGDWHLTCWILRPNRVRLKIIVLHLRFRFDS